MYIYYASQENDYIDENNQPIGFIGKLARVNILVGENNAGKSRFIRNMIKKGNNKCKIYDGVLSTNQEEYLKTDLNYIYNRIRNINTILYSKLENELKNKKELVERFCYTYEFCKRNGELWSNEQINQRLQLTKESNYVSGNAISTDNFYYIPILRGIENFEVYFGSKEKLENIQMTINDMNELNNYIGKAKTIYNNKVSNIYNIDSKKVFTAENLYDEVVDILLGEENKREKFHEFENFINNNFYNGEGFSINPMRTKNCLMVKIRGEKEYEIYNLGDGIKQLIVLLYQIYMHKDEKYMFFIEEPEINLHPGFQRKFMEILLSDDFKKHTYFINTHSNHIIDIINENDDVKLYKFKKKKDKKVITEVNNDYVSILNELGIRSSSIFLSNCTIWVEGISDRIYLKKYLELYFKETERENYYKENIHYSFVEYSGGNLPHWNFNPKIDSADQINVNWLSNNAFLIVDNDDTASKPNSKKHLRKQELQTILGNQYYELGSREIENLISLEILEKMLKKDNNIELLTRKKYNTDQWKSRFNQELLSNPSTYIGSFIDETYDLEKKYKSSTSGTIKQKAEFANKICKEIESFNDLTDEAKKLTEKVAEFIIENN